MTKVQLEAYVREILDKPELKHMLTQFEVNKEEIINQFVAYNASIGEITNDGAYAKIASRFVLHIHESIEGSYHQEIQATVLDYLRSISGIKSIIEVGFGLPAKYITSWALLHKQHRIVLLDKYPSAITYAEKFLEKIDANYQKVVSFMLGDMDAHPSLGAHDCYVFLDSIEHTKKPTPFLRKVVAEAPLHAHFIFSLPICGPLPFHHVHWRTDKDAIHWLESCGLQVKKITCVDINPEVDLFAAHIEGGLHNLVVDCVKNETPTA